MSDNSVCHRTRLGWGCFCCPGLRICRTIMFPAIKQHRHDALRHPKEER